MDFKPIKIRSKTYQCFELLAQSINKDNILKEEMIFFIESKNNHMPVMIKIQGGNMLLSLKKIINYE